jgi:hypothetical protein
LFSKATKFELLVIMRHIAQGVIFVLVLLSRNNNSVALVREQTIPAERLPLVGEVMPTSASVV